MPDEEYDCGVLEVVDELGRDELLSGANEGLGGIIIGVVAGDGDGDTVEGGGGVGNDEGDGHVLLVEVDDIDRSWLVDGG